MRKYDVIAIFFQGTQTIWGKGWELGEGKEGGRETHTQRQTDRQTERMCMCVGLIGAPAVHEGRREPEDS